MGDEDPIPPPLPLPLRLPFARATNRNKGDPGLAPFIQRVVAAAALMNFSVELDVLSLIPPGACLQTTADGEMK